MNFKFSKYYRVVTGESDNWYTTAFLVTVIGKLSMMIIIFIVFSLSKGHRSSSFSGHMTFDFGRDLFVFVIFDPPFESLIVLIIILATKHFNKNYAALTVAIVNVPLHGFSPLSVSVLPGFFLHGIVQRNWRDKGRTFTGYATITIAHFLHNFIGFISFYRIF